MSLTFRQMQVLHAVASMGSVNAAASFLGVSGPAVSMILRDAANAVGFPLFARLGGAMRPTQEAKLLIEGIERVLDAHADVEKLTDQLVSIRLGKLIVASIPTLTEHLLPSALADLSRTNPDIDTLVVTLRGPEVLDEVRKRRCHLGLTIGAERAEGVILFNLFRGDVIVVARRDHPLAGERELALEQLADYPVVSVPRQSPFGKIFDLACQEAQVILARHVEVTHASAAIAFVRAGLGLAIVDPLSAPARDDPEVIAIRLTPSIGLDHQLAIPATERSSRATLKLVAAIRRAARAIVERQELGLQPLRWQRDERS